MPENKADSVPVQLGLFDIATTESINGAMAYINDLDATVVQKQTVRIVNKIRVADRPDHEAFVLITAKSHNFILTQKKLISLRTG